MRWAMVPQEKPPKDGQYYVWHRTMGKCVMGFANGDWGPPQPYFPPTKDGATFVNRPEYWLESDTCPHQDPAGSFANPMAGKAYPIEDEL